MDRLGRLRWLALGIFLLSSALNYLDRSVLSNVAPTVLREFNLTAADFGRLIAVFSLTYAVSSPLMGALIDRVGLTVGACSAVGFWSLAGIATGFVSNFEMLLLCRAALGIFEAGGIPASAKAIALYLPPEGRALGSAMSQFGLTVGMVSAAQITAALAPIYGWRSIFFITGSLGFLWIPLWIWTSRRVPALERTETRREKTPWRVLGERRFLALIGANILSLAPFSLWTQWTTLFFVNVYGLPEAVANRTYVWIPPICATAGGLFGGWVAMRMIQSGQEPVPARKIIAAASSLFVLAMAAAPIAPNPAMATALISLSFAATTCLSVNYYSIPLDWFGGSRAAFSVSCLTASYGVLQFVISPWIGRQSETVGWPAVCAILSVWPLLSVLLLHMATRTARPEKQWASNV